MLIAHTTPAQLRDAPREVDGDDVEAIIQFGANLAFARQAADAERWLGKPVNTSTCWHTLRPAPNAGRSANPRRVAVHGAAVRYSPPG